MNKCNGVMVFLMAGVLSAACGVGPAFTGSAAGASGEGDLAGSGTVAGSSGSANANAGNAADAAGGAATSGGSTADAAGSGGSTAGAGTAGTAGSAMSSAGSGMGTAGSGTAGSGMGSAGSGVGGAANSPCPIATGYYKTITISGAGCGDLDATVPACASATTTACRYNVESKGAKSVGGAISVQPDGSFSGAMIQEGSAKRTGCQGTVSKGVLTIVCGGSDASSEQYCSATLTRSALVCP